MQPVFVLVHSPSVGPLTWAPVADRLSARGQESIVPSLLDVADAAAPLWPRVVEHVTAAVRRFDPDRSVLLVAHSNAGLFVPLFVTHADRPVSGCLFVDAALPAPADATPVAPAELLDILRGKVIDGCLPPWTKWWDEADVAPLFPDPQTRAAVTAEQPRLPLAYYEQMVPVPAGWDTHPCGYLVFGPPYDAVAADARRRGWLVEELPGRHLHQIVDPDAVADRLISMAHRFAATRGLTTARAAARNVSNIVLSPTHVDARPTRWLTDDGSEGGSGGYRRPRARVGCLLSHPAPPPRQLPMAGKHVAARHAHDPLPHRTRRRAGRFVVMLLVVFLLAAAGTAVLALRGRTHHPSVAAASPSCAGEVSVPVIVAPSAAAAVGAIANQWTGTRKLRRLGIATARDRVAQAA